jgi:hypothetical protein
MKNQIKYRFKAVVENKISDTEYSIIEITDLNNFKLNIRNLAIHSNNILKPGERYLFSGIKNKDNIDNVSVIKKIKKYEEEEKEKVRLVLNNLSSNWDKLLGYENFLHKYFGTADLNKLNSYLKK